MNRPRLQFWSLCPAEPFRIFFPLATLLGISGVSLWPLYVSGIHAFYPGVMHARLMIEGFLSGFAMGFLGTAMPKLMGAPALRGGELWSLIVLYLTAAGLHIGHQIFLGDLTFVLLLVLFAVLMCKRIWVRSELPPPGFVLVALGMMAGLSGALFSAGGLKGWLPGNLFALGALWLNQGFVLLLILGVGTFLLPRLLNLPDECKSSQGWHRRAGVSLLVGLILLGSYSMETLPGWSAAAAALRGALVLAYLAIMVPIHRTQTPSATVPLAINLGLLLLLVGMIFPLFWPDQRVAGLHLIFVGSFSLITFTVATRVVLGHSGKDQLFKSPLLPLRITTALLVLGACVRALSDFSIHRSAGLHISSALWMAAAGLWAWTILPNVRIADPEQSN